jgi:hypothetical protein
MSKKRSALVAGCVAWTVVSLTLISACHNTSTPASQPANQNQASKDPFAGTWTLEQSWTMLPLTISSKGGNRFDVGSYDSSTPMKFVHREIVADGVYRPDPWGYPQAITMPSPNVLRSEEKQTGAIQTFTLLDNDSLLRIESNDGLPPATLYRVSGDKGFDGTWEGQANLIDDMDEQIDAKDGGLVLSTPGLGPSDYLRLDGKAYPGGKFSSKDETVSSRRTNDRTIEVVHATQNKMEFTDHYLLSKDGSILTVVTSTRAVPGPTVLIYKRAETPHQR